jgi:hypothetical protein
MLCHMETLGWIFEATIWLFVVWGFWTTWKERRD